MFLITAFINSSKDMQSSFSACPSITFYEQNIIQNQLFMYIFIRMYKTIISILLFNFFLSVSLGTNSCQACYDQKENSNCTQNSTDFATSYTLHMSVHPHLDAFWIFDFEAYYDPKPGQSDVYNYFSQNRFHSVKQIFTTILDVLTESKKIRQSDTETVMQKAHRSFFNSEVGFLKRWYSELGSQQKQVFKQIIKTKYWEILGGGYVQQDEGCSYYEDIIQNFQTGLHFLKEQFNYIPRIAIAADSFGHSQSSLAILAHLGIEGYLVQRSDEHILEKRKTQFIWKAKSANGKYYGALPTHIRWAIHGFEDQFIQTDDSEDKFCSNKAEYISNINRQNQFLKTILESNHIIRYFGHDFQQFDDYSFSVIQGLMDKLSLQKCKKVFAHYTNPTEDFILLMGEVFDKVKPIATREEDIMPIWDYDSGLYWTGYYTTDQHHKKMYRDGGRYLYAVRKAFTPLYIREPDSLNHKQSYRLLEEFAQTVAYLNHHDGISGTSKYQILDKYENLSVNQIEKIKNTILREVFELEYPKNSNNPIFQCGLQSQCQIPEKVHGDIYLKIFKTGGGSRQNIIIHLNEGQFFEPQCQYEINCMCFQFPCACDLLISPELNTHNLIRLKKVSQFTQKPNFLQLLQPNDQQVLTYNASHIQMKFNNREYFIGYKKVDADPTSRNYDHVSRYGEKTPRIFTINSGKYALGNNPSTEQNLSKIRRVLKLSNSKLSKYVIVWERQHMKTIITVNKNRLNEWKIQTLSSAESGKLEDLYLQINSPHIANNNKFYVDSNGWLVMKRELYKRQDFQAFFSPEGYDNINGNSYPMTTFAYIQDQVTKQKISVNTDRPQGFIAYKPSTLWVNFDRLSSDDGKWVYETSYRSQYQKFVHYVTVQNANNNQRRLQKLYDEPLIIQGNLINPSERLQLQTMPDVKKKQEWEQRTNMNNVKFGLRPWNDSSLFLRIQNLNDTGLVTVQLYSDDKICTFLSAFYGKQVMIDEIYELSLGGNAEYQEFLNRKWNWESIIDLQAQNQIFNKDFGQVITLRPLQIRTFKLTGVKMGGKSLRRGQDLIFSSKRKQYRINIRKPIPQRDQFQKTNERIIQNFLLNQDHCEIKSPVLDKTLKNFRHFMKYGEKQKKRNNSKENRKKKIKSKLRTNEK